LRCFNKVWQSERVMGLGTCVLVLCYGVSLSLSLSSEETTLKSCQSKLKYLQGDALLNDSPCLGPDQSPYPRAAIDHMFKTTLRKGRSSKLVDPMETRKTLIRMHEAANHFSGDEELLQRPGRSLMSEFQPHRRPSSPGSPSCSAPGNRLCKTKYNTTRRCTVCR